MARSRVPDRLTPGDAVMLATDVGPVPAQVGVLLDLGDAVPTGSGEPATTLRRRLSATPALRQHPMRVGPLLGRPVWVDDAAFDIDRHLRVEQVSAVGEQAMLDAAAALLIRRLPLSRPPWRFSVLVQPDGRTAVAAVMHHVLADGVRGLALLGTLVDGPSGDQAAADPPGPSPEDVRPPPTRGELFVDAWSERGRALAAVGHLGHAVSTVRAELGQGRFRGAPGTSLNQPGSGRVRLAAVHRLLEPVHAAARQHEATVNDVLLVAVTAGLGAELARRGERPDRLVVSVPMALRGPARAQGIAGNVTGVMPVEVPLVGSLPDRLDAVARATRARRASPGGGSVALMGPVFRTMAGLGVFRAVIERQRLINTFLSNLHGPADPVSVAGVPVSAVVPMGVTAGNVGAQTFAMSYAGKLTCTIVHDPVQLPDPTGVTAGIDTTLDELTR